MSLQELINKAEAEHLETSDVEHAATQLGISIEELCDLVARTIASRYLDGSIEWAYGDRVMNSLHAWAYGPSDVCLSEVAWEVFSAFDEGEYIHQGDPPNMAPDARTRPLLLRLMGDANA